MLILGLEGSILFETVNMCLLLWMLAKIPCSLEKLGHFFFQVLPLYLGEKL